jgi:hypothetical protein
VRNAVKSESNLLHVLLVRDAAHLNLLAELLLGQRGRQFCHAEVERAGILLGRGNSVAGGAMFGTASMLAAEY